MDVEPKLELKPYEPPQCFKLNGKFIYVYDSFSSYVLCYKHADPRVIRVVKVPHGDAKAKKKAFIVYGDINNEFALALGGEFLLYSKYYAAPIFLGTW